MCKGCGWVLVWQFVGQENWPFPACPTKSRPQDITPWYSHCLWQCLWGRKWSIFLPHKNSTPRYHPMVYTLFVTVFVGQEIVNFPAPQKLDPKISPHGIHTVCDSVCGAGNVTQKFEPKISTDGTHTIYDSVCGAGNVTQKLDPKISPHGIHTVCGSVCGAGKVTQKFEPKISPHGTHTIYDSVCGAGNVTQKLGPKISPHGIHTVCGSVYGAGKVTQKFVPKISLHGTHTIYDSVCGAGNGQFACPTKTRPQASKWSKNRGLFDVYAKPKTTSVAKTPLFATLSQHNMSEMLFSKTLVFSVFCENTCMKHRKYQRIQRLHFPWQQAAKSKNTDIYSVSAQWFFQKNGSFWTIFGFWGLPKQRGPPLPHLKF